MLFTRTSMFAFVLVAAAPAVAWPSSQQNQQDTPRLSESTLTEESVGSDIGRGMAQDWAALAKSLRGAGIEPAPFLSKWREGLIKQIPAARLDGALRQQADRMRTAHKLASKHSGVGPEAEVAAVQLLNAGAPADDVDAMLASVAKRDQATARFLSLSFGAARLKNAGASWKEATGFQTGMAQNGFEARDIDDVNEAMAGALKEGLVASRELPDVARKELHSPLAAREFVRTVRRQPAESNLDAPGNDENAKVSKGKDKEKKAKKELPSQSNEKTEHPKGKTKKP